MWYSRWYVRRRGPMVWSCCWAVRQWKRVQLEAGMTFWSRRAGPSCIWTDTFIGSCMDGQRGPWHGWSMGGSAFSACPSGPSSRALPNYACPLPLCPHSPTAIFCKVPTVHVGVVTRYSVPLAIVKWRHLPDGIPVSLSLNLTKPEARTTPSDLFVRKLFDSGHT